MRCIHEASLYTQNSFITLTYKESALPTNGNLIYRDFQLFMKRLRFHYKNRTRFYMCGEYGPEKGRPHFHACLFNVGFDDVIFHKRTNSGADIYTSRTLSQFWPHGFASVGEVTFESAAYVARYIMDKRTGPAAAAYQRLDLETGELFNLTPEFNKMSLKPGIGHEWFQKFKTDVYPRDYVIVRGRKVKPPKYYDRKITMLNPETWELVENSRLEKMLLAESDNTPARLKVRETVARARGNLKSRSTL